MILYSGGQRGADISQGIGNVPHNVTMSGNWNMSLTDLDLPVNRTLLASFNKVFPDTEIINIRASFV